jgi:3-hydroxybutyryl-CoA dehydrogenase
MSEIRSIGVVGAGTMGHGIAQVAATSGHEVMLVDVVPETIDRALAKMRSSMERMVAKEKLTEEALEASLGRISASGNLADLADCDLVVEAVVEKLEIKRQVLSELDEICSPETVLASNTSSISITRLAAATGRPEKVIGMHFMNPVPVMKLVEIIRGLATDQETYDAVETLTSGMGKTPVEVQDSPGFVSNRVLMPMINEAVFCLFEGVGEAAAIDEVMKLGMNHPMGPLALADLIGLDVCLDILDVLYVEFRDPKYRPCPLLVKMVDAGRLGRKSGRGFYDYA